MKQAGLIPAAVWPTVAVVACAALGLALYTAVPGLTGNRLLFGILMSSSAVVIADISGQFPYIDRLCGYGAAYGLLAAAVTVWI